MKFRDRAIATRPTGVAVEREMYRIATSKSVARQGSEITGFVLLVGGLVMYGEHFLELLVL